MQPAEIMYILPLVSQLAVMPLKFFTWAVGDAAEEGGGSPSGRTAAFFIEVTSSCASWRSGS